MEYRNMCGLTPSLLGYGGMRFPIDRETRGIDEEKAQALIDRAMEAGITYYDTAWFYHDKQSEPFLGRALSKYPRDRYYLATKLPCRMVADLDMTRETIEKQLENLQTSYFDFYLLHALNGETWQTMKEMGVPTLLQEYRRQGKLRRIGFSFHDEYEVFEQILNEGDWDFCQIQLNYMDTNHQAGLHGLELARSRGIPVVVMEPVKGGALAQLPDEVSAVLKEMDERASTASWALRWVASQPGVAVVLSGMTTMEQLEDNLASVSPFIPLTQPESDRVLGVADLLRSRVKNHCTACRYCMPCPAGVDIPGSFKVWNNLAMYENKRLVKQAWRDLAEERRPHLCVGCGQCEKACPQNIPIRAHLAQVTGDVEAILNRK